MDRNKLQFVVILIIAGFESLVGENYPNRNIPKTAHLTFKRNTAPDGHRCGVCPTYLQKVCAFEPITNATYIFDNHCLMDLYNCISGTVPTLCYASEGMLDYKITLYDRVITVEFAPMNFDQCIYFGNFAYVHGYRYEDEDYGESHIVVKNSGHNELFEV